MQPELTRALAAALALAWLAAAPLAQGQRPPGADDLARRLQARYETIRDFTADFTQTTRSALLPQTSVDRGSVKMRKPGLMRWDYVEPEKKIAGSDGTDFYIYVVADRVVTFTALPAPGEESTALLFLAGRGNLATDYLAHLPAEQPPGEWHLALTPRRAQGDYAHAILMVERPSLRLLGLETVDDQGGRSTIRFSRYRENVGLRASDFTFTRPRGVEVIRR